LLLPPVHVAGAPRGTLPLKDPERVRGPPVLPGIPALTAETMGGELS